MAEKHMKEWFLNVPWGKLAMVSWGDPGKPPVLLVHGFVDTAASFIPLVAAMPDHYYYVSFDLPGHGRSDSMPGPPISYLHFVEAVRQIVDQLRWRTFHCIAHSMGFLISAYYNAAFPGRVRRLVVLAGLITIGFHGLTDLPRQWFQLTYSSYYKRYYSPSQPVSYTYDEAVSMLAASRGVSEELAAMLATRCLESTGDGKFKFTWDAKARKLYTVLISKETLCSVLSQPTPTLCIVPTEDKTPVPFQEYGADVMTKLTNKFVVTDVPGGHDVHVTNPEYVVSHIVRFFNSQPPTFCICIVSSEDKTVPFQEYGDDVMTKLTNKFVVTDVPGGHDVHVTNSEYVVSYIVRFFNSEIKSMF